MSVCVCALLVWSLETAIDLLSRDGCLPVVVLYQFLAFKGVPDPHRNTIFSGCKKSEHFPNFSLDVKRYKQDEWTAATYN
uniref:Putative secreted protein n=1 Tax=Anopheles darlingi TaxID=43151 RepID=A0A2M4DKM7_ANODA